MIKYENDCVGPCPQGCIGEGCAYHNAPHYYCDECGREYSPEELYRYDGKEVCGECILADLRTVAQ